VPKRTFWMTAGVAVGVGSTLWAERKVRRTVEQATARLQPDALVVEVGRSARHMVEGTGDRVRAALATGREEMERREEELWEELTASGRIDPTPVEPRWIEPAPVLPRPSARRIGRRRAS
jgi:hypothetical protein